MPWRCAAPESRSRPARSSSGCWRVGILSRRRRGAKLQVEASRCLADVGETRAALEAVRVALTEAPDSREAVFQAIGLERLALDHTAALLLCEAALGRWPDDEGLVRQKAVTLTQAGDMSGVEAVLSASRHQHADLWIGLDLDLRRFDRARQRLDAQIATGELTPALQRLEIPPAAGRGLPRGSPCPAAGILGSGYGLARRGGAGPEQAHCRRARRGGESLCRRAVRRAEAAHGRQAGAGPSAADAQ